MTPAEAAAWLGVSVLGLTSSVLKTAFRQKANLTHPDKGGSQEDFLKSVQANSVLEPLASTDPSPETDVTPCEVCKGKGRVIIMNGFNQMPMKCSACSGRGAR